MKILMGLLRSLVRLLVVWLADAVSLLVTAWILPGINITQAANFPAFVIATAAAFVLGIVNFLIRPFLLMIALPLGWVAIFLSGFFINGFVLCSFDGRF